MNFATSELDRHTKPPLCSNCGESVHLSQFFGVAKLRHSLTGLFFCSADADKWAEVDGSDHLGAA